MKCIKLLLASILIALLAGCQTTREDSVVLDTYELNPSDNETHLRLNDKKAVLMHLEDKFGINASEISKQGKLNLIFVTDKIKEDDKSTWGETWAFMDEANTRVFMITCTEGQDTFEFTVSEAPVLNLDE
jgi:ABC-type uncharacterized transport system auxiliary subunit